MSSDSEDSSEPEENKEESAPPTPNSNVKPPKPTIIFHKPLPKKKTAVPRTHMPGNPQSPIGLHYGTTNGTQLLNHLVQEHLLFRSLDKSMAIATEDDLKSILNFSLCNYFAWELDREDK